MGSNDYQAPAVYVPVASGVIHQTPRERIEIDADRQGADKGSVKATEVPTSHAVRKSEGSAETGSGKSGLDAKAERRSVADHASLVRAQELARETQKNERAEKAAEKDRRAAVASPSEMVGAAEDLQRLDQNRDGRIDQLEVQHSIRAEGDDTTYGALLHYRKAMGFGAVKAGTEKQADEPKKLFADDIAKADEEKRAAGVEQNAGGDGVVDSKHDSSKVDPKADGSIKITV